MVNDTISDFITRIRNAILVRHKIIETPLTKITISIAENLKLEGLIERFEVFLNSSRKSLLIFLKYKNGGRKPTISFLKRISKPGRRIYINRNNFPQIVNSYGIGILSTSLGIITDKKARLLNVGGEILLYIY